MSRISPLTPVLALVLATVGSVSAAAATLEVAADLVVVAADGQCSLREAIHNANANAQVDNADCPAGSEVDTVVLVSGGQYVLADADADNDHNGLPVVTTEIVVEGHGATIELDSGFSCVLDDNRTAEEFRILEVELTGDLTLKDLTLRGGCADGSGSSNDGGALRVDGNLSLTRVLVEQNSALDKSGGLDTSGAGSISIVDSSFRGNHGGGGAGAMGHGSGMMTIEGSTISGNTSGGQGGGGIGNFGTLILRDSTISGNSTTGDGGGGVGNQGTMQIEHSTIVGNSAAGVIGGGGIGNAGALEIKNSLVASNGDGGDCVNVNGFGTFAATGHNFDTDGSCAALDADFTQVAPVDLDLGPLAANGGPTKTHALGAASLALEAATDCTRIDGTTPVDFDQRGVSRPQDGDGGGGPLCDVGSFEALPPGVDAHSVDGVTCTLGDAIEAANQDFTVGGCVDIGVGADQIYLEADVVLGSADDRSSVLEGAWAGLPDVTSEISIGPGKGGARFIMRDPALDCDVADGPDEFRLLQVLDNGALTLNGVTLANGCADRGGAVLVVDTATLTVDSVTFTGNTARSAADAEGGAISTAPSASVSIAGSTFEQNLAAGKRAEGGALWDSGALVSLTASRFLANQALALQDGTNGNLALGGAARVGEPTMSDLVFDDNLARGADGTGRGGDGIAGALYIGGFEATLTDALFSRNTVRGGDGGLQGGDVFGGALFTNNSGAAIERVSLEDNLAEGGNGSTLNGGSAFAGGVYCNEVSILDHITLSGNEVRGGSSDQALGGDARGGGLYLESTFGPTLLRHSTVAGNRAIAGSGLTGDGGAEGGGLRVSDALQIASSLLEGNTATVGATTTASPCFDEPSPNLTSLGFNTVAEASPDCVFDGSGDQTAVGPSLLPLGGYGCSAQLPAVGCLPTHPVDLTGPAIDQGSCTASGAIADARGLSRPVDLAPADADDGCDAGAYESRDEDANGLEDGLEVFADGFETGDTTAWSSAAP